MMHMIHTFLEFCYIMQRDVTDTQSLRALEEALSRFHCHHIIFEGCGIHAEGFNLPQQHFLEHYPTLIQMFGAPNGLCSSITESKYIKAVKQLWQHSNHCDSEPWLTAPRAVRYSGSWRGFRCPCCSVRAICPYRANSSFALPCAVSESALSVQGHAFTITKPLVRCSWLMSGLIK